jgi:hypothetical protein
MTFSDTVTNLGIVQQVRTFMRVDSAQWSTSKIVASVNNYLDTVTGYAIGADRTFQWDDTNHTKLPVGTTDLNQGQTDYSFLNDEQGNTILTLTRVEVKDATGSWHLLRQRDMSQSDMAVDQELIETGIPSEYDKIADNIVRLYPTPSEDVDGGLKFYFQRTPSYFTAADTTKEPGVPSLLHRGFVIAAAYDGAITLGLSNLNYLAAEMNREEEKLKQYFTIRNKDVRMRMSMKVTHSPH